MRHLLLLIILMPFASVAAPPAFESFAVPLHSITNFARIKIPKSGIDWKMEDYLRYSDDDPPNFADKYTLIDVGCGTGCFEFCLIDRTSGKVYPGKDFNCEYPADYHGPMYFQYHRDSRLLVVYESFGAQYPVHVKYYIWKGAKLKLLETHDIEAPKKT
jgi:hypothetical protein